MKLWYNSIDPIEIVEIDGKLYALYGWNGEKFCDCWKCANEFTAINENRKYIIAPIYKMDEYEDFEIVGYKIE